MNSLTFKKGEAVIVYDGRKSRNSIELAQIGEDVSYIDQECLITCRDCRNESNRRYYASR